MAFKCTGKLQKLVYKNRPTAISRLISIAKASISCSKVNLINILQGICSLICNIIPPLFPVRSGQNGTEYPDTQN